MKDREFLTQLRRMMDEKQLSVELKDDGYLRMVLRKNYGDEVERIFRLTRQGVRWRFNHIFNDAYVNALMAIMLVESGFGTELRSHAMAIAKQRIEFIQKAQKQGVFGVHRRETEGKVASKQTGQ